MVELIVVVADMRGPRRPRSRRTRCPAGALSSTRAALAIRARSRFACEGLFREGTIERFRRVPHAK